MVITAHYTQRFYIKRQHQKSIVRLIASGILTAHQQRAAGRLSWQP